MSKHTPGPWHYYKCQCKNPVCNQHTISVQRSVGFEEADARLIAAAPEMLEALRAMLEVWGEDSAYGHASAEKARAAIAKVEGEKT